MTAKAAIVSLFALVLAAAAVCGEQYRLGMATAVDAEPASGQAAVDAKEVDVTN